MFLVVLRKRADDAGCELVVWDSNTNVDKLLMLEAKLVEVSTDISIISTFKLIKSCSHSSHDMTALHGELCLDGSPPFSNSFECE